MAAKKKASKRKYGSSAGKKVEKVMRERKKGTLRSGSTGKKVTSKKQAIAIGLSEARRSGAKVPKPKKSARKRAAKKAAKKSGSGVAKKSARKSTAKKRASRKTTRKTSTS